MKTTLTQPEVDSYRENGFLLINDFLDADELNQWRQAAISASGKRLSAVRQKTEAGELRPPLLSRLRSVAETIIGQRTTEQIRQAALRYLPAGLVSNGLSSVLDTNQGQPDSFYANVYTQVIGSSRDDEVLHRLVRDPRLGAVAAQLSGVQGVRVYQDQALFKLARNNFTAWHLDTPFWSFHAREALTMWLALDDATPDNGCMRYLPGTHRLAHLKENRSIGANFTALFDLYPAWREITPRLCPCRAGSAIFHNGLTAHAAGANTTDLPRRAYTIAFMPDGACFNGIRDVMPQEQFKSLRIGDRLDNDRLYPLIWTAANQVSPSRCH